MGRHARVVLGATHCPATHRCKSGREQKLVPGPHRGCTCAVRCCATDSVFAANCYPHLIDEETEALGA